MSLPPNKHTTVWSVGIVHTMYCVLVIAKQDFYTRMFHNLQSRSQCSKNQRLTTAAATRVATDNANHNTSGKFKQTQPLHQIAPMNIALNNAQTRHWNRRIGMISLNFYKVLTSTTASIQWETNSNKITNITPNNYSQAQQQSAQTSATIDTAPTCHWKRRHWKRRHCNNVHSFLLCFIINYSIHWTRSNQQQINHHSTNQQQLLHHTNMCAFRMTFM